MSDNDIPNEVGKLSNAPNVTKVEAGLNPHEYIIYLDEDNSLFQGSQIKYLEENDISITGIGSGKFWIYYG